MRFFILEIRTLNIKVLINYFKKIFWNTLNTKLATKTKPLILAIIPIKLKKLDVIAPKISKNIANNIIFDNKSSDSAIPPIIAITITIQLSTHKLTLSVYLISIVYIIYCIILHFTIIYIFFYFIFIL